MSVLIGLCDGARSLCCFPFVGPVDRGDKGDICDAIALDRRKDRIDGRRHRDRGNHLRRNPGQGANSSVSRLNASLSSRALQTAREPLRGRIRLVRRKQRLRTTLSIVTARAWMPENRGILSTIHPSNA